MNWERVRLGEVCNMKSGGTPSRKKSSFFGGNIKWCKISDIENATEGIVYDTEEKITEEGLSDINGRIFSEGTLLLAMYGSVGKVAFINEQMSVNQAILGINIKNLDILDSKFLYYWFIGERRNLVNKAVGVTLKNISKGIVESLTIPLPPMSVQKEIVEKLDKAAAIREKSKALLAHYDALAESLFIELFGDPISNEKGWEKKKLGEVCVKIGSGATPRGGRESYLSEGISFIRSLNVYDREFKYKDLAFIDENQAYDLRNVIVEEGDVLFNITGASVCRSCVIPLNVLPARVNQHVSILRCKKDIVNPIFLNAQLVSDSKKNQLIALSKIAGATREAITKVQLENEEILIPPLSLQVKFAEMVENIEEQKARAKAEIEQSEAVFQALLQESFG